MRQARWAAAVLCLFLALPFGRPSAVEAQYEGVIARAKRAVALVTVRTQERKVTGTGFFIDPHGYVLTARHVIEDAISVQVAVWNGKTFQATIVGFSASLDAAILKVNGTGFPTLPLGNSDKAQIGHEILVLGYPYATSLGTESITATRGIISGLRARRQLIQIDAALNPGNSGGPVINLRGEVIGIAVAGAGQLINIAVAINGIRPLIDRRKPVPIAAPTSGKRPPQEAQKPSPPEPNLYPSSIEIRLFDGRIEATTSEVRAGRVEFEVQNLGTLEHGIVISHTTKYDVSTFSFLQPGSISRFLLHLQPGAYTVSCRVAGHAEAGERITLQVR